MYVHFIVCTQYINYNIKYNMYYDIIQCHIYIYIYDMENKFLACHLTCINFGRLSHEK